MQKFPRFSWKFSSAYCWKKLDKADYTQTFLYLCSWGFTDFFSKWGLENFHEILKIFTFFPTFSWKFSSPHLLEKFWKPKLHRKRKVCVVGLVQFFSANGGLKIFMKKLEKSKGFQDFHENFQALTFEMSWARPTTQTFLFVCRWDFHFFPANELNFHESWIF